MKDKKGLIMGLIIVSVVVIIGGYFGYKLYNYSVYNYDFTDTINFYNTDDIITINSELLNEEDYIVYKNIKIKNEFEDCKQEIINDVSNDYAFFADDNYLLLSCKNSRVTISITSQNIDTMYRANLNYIGDKIKNISNEDRIDYIDKINVKNDLELYDYLANKDNYKMNIFTSVKDMKGMYSLYLVASVHDNLNFTLINGDYTGYMFSDDYGFEVNIIKNDKRHVFIFMGNSFDKDSIINLLNTLVIEDK